MPGSELYTAAVLDVLDGMGLLRQTLPSAIGPSGRRREQAHAEHRDCSERAHDGVRDAEVVLDRREERPGPDDLRPQRERGEEERRESARPSAQKSSVS